MFYLRFFIRITPSKCRRSAAIPYGSLRRTCCLESSKYRQDIAAVLEVRDLWFVNEISVCTILHDFLYHETSSG